MAKIRYFDFTADDKKAGGTNEFFCCTIFPGLSNKNIRKMNERPKAQVNYVKLSENIMQFLEAGL